MQGALEWPQVSEHGCRLDQLNMVVQALWKTVAGCSDDALPTV